MINYCAGEFTAKLMDAKTIQSVYVKPQNCWLKVTFKAALPRSGLDQKWVDLFRPERSERPQLITMTIQANWIEPELLPGYRVSRSSIQVTDYGLKHGAVEPQLGRTRDGALAYWVRPVGFSFMVFIKLEGLSLFFRGNSSESRHGHGSPSAPSLV